MWAPIKILGLSTISSAQNYSTIKRYKSNRDSAPKPCFFFPSSSVASCSPVALHGPRALQPLGGGPDVPCQAMTMRLGTATVSRQSTLWLHTRTGPTRIASVEKSPRIALLVPLLNHLLPLIAGFTRRRASRSPSPRSASLRTQLLDMRRAQICLRLPGFVYTATWIPSFSSSCVNVEAQLGVETTYVRPTPQKEKATNLEAIPVRRRAPLHR